MFDLHRPRRFQTLAATLVLCLSFTGFPAAQADPAMNSAQQDIGDTTATITSQPLARYVLEESVQSPAPGNKQAVIKRYGPCTLKANNVHVRSSSTPGVKIIGFKPVTECSRAVESIRHESRIKYKYYLWWRDAPLRHGVPTVSTNRGVSKLEQKNVEFQCNGDVMTTFIGNTKGTIVSNGETFHADANSNVFEEACRV